MSVRVLRIIIKDTGTNIRDKDLSFFDRELNDPERLLDEEINFAHGSGRGFALTSHPRPTSSAWTHL